MSEFVTIELQNFLFNAGIVGFINMLEKNGFHERTVYQINGSTLLVPKDFFSQNNIADLYFKALRDKFEEDTLYYKICCTNDMVKTLDLTDIKQVESMNEKFKTQIEPLRKRASYISAIEIISNKGNDFNMFEAITKAKDAKEPEERRSYILKVTEYIKNYPDVFCFKDIAYTKIQRFWGDVAFLNRGNSKKDMVECYRDTFVKPLVEWISKDDKSKDICIECRLPVSASKANGLSWLSDMGVDHKRKRSYFWGFAPDSLLCPICSLVYSCVPLGFMFPKESNDSIFINNNSSIQSLISTNSSLLGIRLEGEAEARDNLGKLTYRILNKILDIQLQNKKMELDNIQVIIKRDDNRYQFSILSKDKIEVIKNSSESFEKIVNRSYKTVDGKWVNLYEKAVGNLLESISMYPLIDSAIRAAIEGEYSTRYLCSLLDIEINRKGENAVISSNAIYKMMHEGERFKIELSKHMEDPSNKIKGYAYQLLNNLQVGNSTQFMNVVSRMHIGYGVEIPTLFTNILTDDEAFRQLGYAYIIGLKSGKKANDDENN